MFYNNNKYISINQTKINKHIITPLLNWYYNRLNIPFIFKNSNINFKINYFFQKILYSKKRTKTIPNPSTYICSFYRNLNYKKQPIINPTRMRWSRIILLYISNLLSKFPISSFRNNHIAKKPYWGYFNSPIY